MAFHLFGNYSKPGPGVSKDEPPKPAFFRFWTIFFRKWTKFAQLNLIFIIPVIAVVALFFFINRFSSLVWICAIPVVFLFPFWGGLTYITTVSYTHLDVYKRQAQLLQPYSEMALQV